MTEVVEFDGPCPFLMCLTVAPHSHPVCPECDAVRYGNMSCPTCRANRGPIDAELRGAIELLRMEEHAMTEDMVQHFANAVYLFAQAVGAQARIAGMQSDNALRAHQDYSPAYSMADFEAVIADARIVGNDALTTLGQGR